MQKITVNPRLERVKIVVIGEAASWREAARVKLTSHQGNMKRLSVVHYNIYGMVGLRHEGQY